jgi:hypothetical protein
VETGPSASAGNAQRKKLKVHAGLATTVARTTRKSAGKFSVGQALSGACDNLVNQSSELIHQLYQRECVDDMAQ